MDTSICADACSVDARDIISSFPFQRTFVTPVGGKTAYCPLDFAGTPTSPFDSAGAKTFCRQQHMGGALIDRAARSVGTRFRGAPLHEVETPYLAPRLQVNAFPGCLVDNDTAMHQVTIARDRRRLTVQRPWGYTHQLGAEPAAPRPVDTRGANFTTTTLGR